MEPKSQQPLASKVVEEPRSRLTLYLVVAAVVAIAAWSFQQQDVVEPSHQRAQSGTPEVTKIESRTPDPDRARGDLRTLFTGDDYPADAQRRGEQGTVQAQLTVDSSGKVSGCTIIHSSGYPTLDQATCSILQRRARFTPARDSDGNAVAARVTTPPVVWKLEG